MAPESRINPAGGADAVATPAETSVNRLAVGASVSLFGSMLGRGLDFVKQIAIARLIGPEAFGLYAIGWNTLRIIDLLASLGLHNGVIHFGTPFWRKDGSAFKGVVTRSILLSFLIGWLITAVLLLIAPWLTGQVFGEPEFLPLFRVFCLMLPFIGALRVAASASRISQRMQYAIASEEIGQASLNLIAFAILYFLGWELLGAVVATVLSFVGAFLLSIYFLRRLFADAFAQPARHAISSRELLRYSAPTAMAGMFGVIINRIDRLFLGYFGSSAEVGIYQAAAQLSIIMALVLNAFNTILMPMIAEQYYKRDMAHLQELFRINTKWGIYAVLPLVLVILFASEDVMTVLFGAAYAPGAPSLVILTVGQFINTATGATGTLLIMTGHQTAWFRLSMVLMVISLLLNVTLIPAYGMIGAAIATATTVGGLFTISLVIVAKTLRLWPYDRRYLKGIVAALITMGLLFGVGRFSLSPILNLITSAAVAGFGFFGLLLLLGLDPEDRAFIGMIRGRMKGK